MNGSNWARRSNRFLLLVLLAPGLCMLAGTASTIEPSADPDTIIASARKAVESANSDWVPAMERGDALAMAAPYADDGVLITSAGQAIRGRTAIVDYYQSRLAAMGRVVGGRLIQQGMTSSEGLIYEWGRGSVTLRQKGGSLKESGGSYLTVWRRGADGTWRIIRNLVL